MGVPDEIQLTWIDLTLLSKIALNLFDAGNDVHSMEAECGNAMFKLT